MPTIHLLKTSIIHTPRITGGFWGKRLEMNSREAIFYQWEQLEQSRCIDNFRIARRADRGFPRGLLLRRFRRLQVAGRRLAHPRDELPTPNLNNWWMISSP